MSGVYPYCIVEAGHHPPADLTGLGGNPVRPHDVGPFTIWVSREASQPAFALERIVEHHEVVRSAAVRTTPVPVRFGSWARDEATLWGRIEQSRNELEAALAAVAGRLEFGVRILSLSAQSDVPAHSGPAEGPDGSPPGRAYMRGLSRVYAGRRRWKEEQDGAAQRLRTCLEGLQRGEKMRYLESPGLVSAAHLVDRGDEGRYRERLGQFARDEAQVYEVHVTGPWAPYSFAPE